MSEIKTYATTIGFDEMFEAIQTGKAKNLAKALDGMLSFIGAHPNAEQGFVAYLFTTSDDRNKFQAKAQELGYETAAVFVQPMYVDTKYLQKGAN